MHFYTLALPLVFFSLVFTKVVSVVLSRFWIWIIELIFFPFIYFSFVFTFFTLNFFFFFPFCFFLLSFVSCVLSYCGLPTLCYLELLLHHHLVALMASSLPRCLVTIVTSLLFCYFDVASSQLVTPSMPCCFVATRCYLIALHFTTLLPCSLLLPFLQREAWSLEKQAFQQPQKKVIVLFFFYFSSFVK
jgi:hypothetical protein